MSYRDVTHILGRSALRMVAVDLRVAVVRLGQTRGTFPLKDS